MRDSHFVPYDSPGTRSAMALCGRFVDRRRDHANAPTCPQCRVALAEDEAALDRELHRTPAHEDAR